MTVIAAKDRETVRDLLARELTHDVELLFFTRPRSGTPVPGQEECLTCDETRELLEQLVELSDHLRLTTHDLASDPDAGTRYNVGRVPAVLLRRVESGQVDNTVPNVRFLGEPAGYEFSTLVADIVDVSRAQTSLTAETREAIRALDVPVHLQVFVTPT
jgi:alkyl hydroperoxide reductase subunit AhpF